MNRIIKATALALGIVLGTATVAIACEYEPEPTPEPAQVVFIFCGANAIHHNRVDVIFQGSPRGWTRIGGLGEPTFQEVWGASATNWIDIRLGKVSGLIEAAVPGTGEVVSRNC